MRCLKTTSGDAEGAGGCTAEGSELERRLGAVKVQVESQALCRGSSPRGRYEGRGCRLEPGECQHGKEGTKKELEKETQSRENWG